MKETFITEVNYFDTFVSTFTCQYPEIQKLLDDEYIVKENFCMPLTTEHGRVIGVSLTVHLYKSE